MIRGRMKPLSNPLAVPSDPDLASVVVETPASPPVAAPASPLVAETLVKPKRNPNRVERSDKGKPHAKPKPKQPAAVTEPPAPPPAPTATGTRMVPRAFRRVK